MAIRKTNNGKWYAEVYLGEDSITGKKLRKTKTFELQREAKEWERQIIQGYKDGTLNLNQNIKLSEYLDYWYNTYVMVNTKYQTQKRYDVLMRCVKDHLGHLRLDKIKVQHVDRFYADLQKEMRTLKSGVTKRRYSNGTILKVHRVFRQALEKAVGWDMIIKNPVHYATPPKDDVKDVEIWTMKQVNTFFAKIKGEQIYLPCFIAYHTGLRIGEICALRWQDVNFEDNLLMVDNNAVEVTGEGVRLDSPKTESSKAPVTLTSELAKALKITKKKQQLHKLEHGIKKSFTFVCSRKDAKPLRPTYISRRFKQLIEQYKMPKLTPHGLRHTHASVLFELGESSHAISKRLRHSRVSTTDDIYIHLTEETKKSTAELFNKAVEESK